MDIVCLSHLRWDFVYQRPNHLMARAAQRHRVFFVEEPVPAPGLPRLDLQERDGVTIAVPHLPPGAWDDGTVDPLLRHLLDDLVETQRLDQPIAWFLTPVALSWADGLAARSAAVVYDCMDDLSGFAGAHGRMRELEVALIGAADVVFTGGHALYEARRGLHPNLHPFPSAVDTRHFRQAREPGPIPADLVAIPGPRVGYVGVLDERIDWPLIAELADARPDLSWVLVGPVAKVDPAELPRRDNLHYLGPKAYAELPGYLRGFDVAMMPFAHNAATRYISPTKTPEYLAAGCAVASTSIRDVVHPYADIGFVHVGDGADRFLAAVDAALRDDPARRLLAVDAFLATRTWDATWDGMWAQIERAIAARAGAKPATRDGAAEGLTDGVRIPPRLAPMTPPGPTLQTTSTPPSAAAPLIAATARLATSVPTRSEASSAPTAGSRGADA